MEPAASSPQDWYETLSEEERHFIRRFLLASGSLKDLAAQYDVSYPTIRLRLDRLIEKTQAAESPEATDPLRRRVQLMVAEGTLSIPHAKALINAHESAMKLKQSSL